MLMKVLHVFDRYLNTTMNWAHRLIKSTEAETHISAPIQFQSEFRESDFHYHLNSIQRFFGLAQSEWKVRLADKLLSALFQSYHQSSAIKYCQSNSIDIVHFHFATVATRYPRIITSNKFKNVISFYGYDYEHAPFKDSSILEKYDLLFANADLFLTEGSHGKEKLISMGCPPEKVEVLHLGVDVKYLGNKGKVKPKGQLHMIQPATFTPKKGFEFSISAVHQALKKCPNLKLTIVGEIGDAHYYHLCLDMIKRNELDSHIELIPFIEKSQWLHQLGQYDVLIQPSVYSDNMDCEGGVPVSLIDAQSLGIPAISTYHCDIPDVVKNGVTGRLCNEKNVDQLSEAIEYFYNMDTSAYQAYSENAIDHIRRDYDIAKSGSQLTSRYQSLIS